MDKTDDDKGVDVADGSSILPTSTKTDEVEGWMNEKERTMSIGLTGYNTQGQKIYPDSYYYTPNEWSRSIGWGPVPSERLKKGG